MDVKGIVWKHLIEVIEQAAESSRIEAYKRAECKALLEFKRGEGEGIQNEKT